MSKTDMEITLDINGEVRNLTVKQNWTLLYVLREVLGLTGTKHGCGTNDCGACRVLVDGKAVNSCVIPARTLPGKKIVTIEGLLKDGELSIVQQAFVDSGAVQCGFCTPGMVVSATALLEKNINPTENEIRNAIKDNLCRCTGYVRIVEAIKLAAERTREYLR